METSKFINVSDCCEELVDFFPASLGESGFYFCEKCKTQCTVHEKEIVTHIKIEDGVYRPVR